jgi:hypothetical protein
MDQVFEVDIEGIRREVLSLFLQVVIGRSFFSPIFAHPSTALSTVLQVRDEGVYPQYQHSYLSALQICVR